MLSLVSLLKKTPYQDQNKQKDLNKLAYFMSPRVRKNLPLSIKFASSQFFYILRA